MSTGRIDLLIASRRASSIPGGLARYQENLVRELQDRYSLRIAVCSAGAETLSSAHREFEIPLPASHPPRRTWMRLASRPALHPILETWISLSYKPLLSSLADLKPAAVHFIGTGWDFFGFAMAHLAHKQGARFSVWPAVHPGQWGDDRIDIRLYRHAHTVFCQSRHEADHLARRGLEMDRTVLSGLPPMCLPDGNGPGFRQRHGLGDRPAVLFIGRREPEKGFDALVRAWREVNLRRPDAVLILAGPGKSIQPSDFLSATAFFDLGIPDEKEKADALAACDIFCLPSSHESFGIVFAEAWSYDKPVVCGAAPAPREWIGDGTTGLWTDGQPEDITAKLLRLLEDPSLRQSIGKAGGDFQRKSLTWNQVAPAHLQAFGLCNHDGIDR